MKYFLSEYPSIKHMRGMGALLAAAVLVTTGCSKSTVTTEPEQLTPEATPASSLVVISGPADFQQKVVEAPLPVLVDFWATWCPPCKFMNPIIAELAGRHQLELRVAKVDIDHNQDLAGQYNIRAVPTLMLFYQGKVIALHEGAMRQPALNQWIQDQLKQAGINFPQPAM